MGTSVTAGTGRAVVVAAAMNTELGRIAGLIEEAGAEESTPLQQKLNSFGRVLVWATLGRFLKTSSMPFTDCLWLLALGAIPLLVLEMVKVVRMHVRLRSDHQRSTAVHEQQG